MKIGLRTIKTGIAVGIALLVVQLFEIESVVFITIAALIGMQPTLSDSWQKGANRLYGTIVGAAFGVLLALILPSHFLLASLGVVVLIMIMNRLNIPEGITISSVVFISIFMNSDPDRTIYAYALSRLTDTVLGISIALLVNYYILPPKYDRKAMLEMRKDMTRIMVCQNRMLGMLLKQQNIAQEDIEEEMQAILLEIEESKKLAEMQEKEERHNVYGTILFEEIDLVLHLTTDMYQHLQNLFGLVCSGVSAKSLMPVNNDLLRLYGQMKKVEEKMVAGEVKEAQVFNELMVVVKQIKHRIKSEEVYKQLETEEVVKLMVMVYNIGEILSKMDVITTKRHA